MPIVIGETINEIADKLLKGPMVNVVARNPVLTSLVIVFCVVLVVLFVFRDAETDEGLMFLSVRVGFWVFLGVVGVMLLHDRVLSIETNEIKTGAAYAGVFNNEYEQPRNVGVALEDSVIPVNINTTFD